MNLENFNINEVHQSAVATDNKTLQNICTIYKSVQDYGDTVQLRELVGEVPFDFTCESIAQHILDNYIIEPSTEAIKIPSGVEPSIEKIIKKLNSLEGIKNKTLSMKDVEGLEKKTNLKFSKELKDFLTNVGIVSYQIFEMLIDKDIESTDTLQAAYKFPKNGIVVVKDDEWCSVYYAGLGVYMDVNGKDLDKFKLVSFDEFVIKRLEEIEKK